MIRLALTLSALMATSAQTARAQTIAVEADQTIGQSSEGITAVASQLRVFGEGGAGIRFNVEGAWAARSADGSDVFGGAYPYDQRFNVIEAYGERVSTPRHALLALRLGRYRTPFGISSGSDHGYIGFLRPPLIRYDGYYALSNTFLEHGADLVVGTPRLSVETSLGVPADVGEARRGSGLDTVVRGQAVFGSVILGASYVSSQPYLPRTFARGLATFSGLDVRWMRGGVQLRGEWIWGQPFDGTATQGGYADAIVHRPSMGPVTAVMRAERLAYDATAPFALSVARYTVGARVRLVNQLALQVEAVRESEAVSSSTALDVGLTLSLRHDSAR
jgi:hypothetical protein